MSFVFSHYFVVTMLCFDTVASVTGSAFGL